jgi:hypothetical protein
MTSVDNGARYLDGYERATLLFPAKANDYTKLFAMNKTCDGSYFSKPIGREID